MAAPGLGVGDIISACRIIYDCSKKFADAPNDLRIIADKAWSLETTLERIEYEGLLKGNIVQLAGHQAEEQLRAILKPLRKDVKTIKELVQKYDAIRQDYGRRLMFALKESSGLADLRRQIELHEQTLQMWFTTVIASSLRRILSRIDDVIEIFRTMRKIDPKTTEKIREKVNSNTASRFQVVSLCAKKASHRAKLDSIPITVTKADAKPLKKELLKRGLSEAQIDANLDEAIGYLFANKDGQDQMEEEVRQRASTMRGQTTRYEDRRPTNSSNPSRPFYHNQETLHLHNRPHEETTEIPEVLNRSRSSGQPRRVNVERPPPGYLDVPEPSTRYRYFSPSRHYARSESPSLDSEMVQVRCPRIERSQSPSPGVTHYFFRE